MRLPVLWSFRRCPYAMRARLAIDVSGQSVALREVVLRDKPAAFLAVSPSATVPCLDLADRVIDESLDIMRWALARYDPDGWLTLPSEGDALIEQNDGPFKLALDQYKYSVRHPEVDMVEARGRAARFVTELEVRLSGRDALFGRDQSLADMAILPFVRQFAHVDLEWFHAQPWPSVIAWLEAFKASARFKSIMGKYPAWRPGDAERVFPDRL